LYIKDVGAFEFDKGKILIPKVKDKQHLSVMSEPEPPNCSTEGC
jgi:hypothetical protein